MLIFHGREGVIAAPASLDGATAPAGTTWVDAESPTEEEAAYLSRVLGVRVPSYARLVEIESSSRLAREKNTVLVSLQLVIRTPEGLARGTPLGFILSKELLLTMHYEPLKALKDHIVHVKNGGSNGSEMTDEGNGAAVGDFLTIVECIIDHVADALENVGVHLDEVSSNIFDDRPASRREPRKEGDNLRQILRQLGRAGDLTAKISDSLLGMGRMIPYVSANAADYINPAAKARLDSLTRDIVSLNDYETHLTDKIQMLVDVTLGFTNVEQNNVFRVLTVFSIIGIPPTFFASMYGMNFKTMPEYDWAWGYPYGLTLIILSAIIPAAWFKWRGWW